MSRDPKEAAGEAVDRAIRELEASKPAIQTSAALEVVLQQLIILLIKKKVLDPQEVLDAFASLSDEIQYIPDSATAVQTVERLCSRISELPGVKRSSA